jgi:hypothetical protein
MAGRIKRWARYAWAAPYSGLGIGIGVIVLALGGTWETRGGVLEFAGNPSRRGGARLPASFRFVAITLGHVVLGVNRATLDAVRRHEHVHVRQYERWGPLFVPAYLLASLVELLLGGRPYRDNAFEREAYGERNDRHFG